MQENLKKSNNIPEGGILESVSVTKFLNRIFIDLDMFLRVGDEFKSVCLSVRSVSVSPAVCLSVRKFQSLIPQ